MKVLLPQFNEMSWLATSCKVFMLILLMFVFASSLGSLPKSSDCAIFKFSHLTMI